MKKPYIGVIGLLCDKPHESCDIMKLEYSYSTFNFIKHNET